MTTKPSLFTRVRQTITGGCFSSRPEHAGDSTVVVSNTVPFGTRITPGGKHILERDLARAQKLLAGLHPHGPVAFHRSRKEHGQHKEPVSNPAPDSSAGGKSIDVTDAAVTYTMQVGVGKPATEYTLLIDTGSSNTWVGADKRYKPTSTAKNTKKTVSVSYGSGQFTGTEYIDTVTLGSGLVIKNQSIGVAKSAEGFNGVDGILGIGPVDLTQGTVANTSSVPTVTDNLFAQGTIPSASIGISYIPTTSSDAANGEITFGGVDSGKFTGTLNYVPLTQTSPASNYWGIDQSLTYGKTTQLLTGSSGIVDTGTTLLLIATDAFSSYQAATGAKLDETTGLLTITQAQYDNLQSLFFDIGGVTYELTPNAQIWPRSLNSTIGGEPDQIYLVTADMGSLSGNGLDFINGFAFLQRFYSVYDSTNSQLGLATTLFTEATTN